MQFDILFEDGEALVIDKPAGLPLDRPRAGGKCLEDRLDELKLGFQREPAPVHRLDRDTSGCLLLARNPKALKRFSAAFEERQVEKRYLGIVAGEVEGEEGTIALNLSKVSTVKDGWRMIPARKGKPAITRWRVVERRTDARDAPLTLVEFRPETGRTHQIRVHAASGLGAALLGDPVYGDSKGADRTMLHAAGLVVPRGEKPPVVAVSPMPADFRALGFSDAANDAAKDGASATGNDTADVPDSDG